MATANQSRSKPAAKPQTKPKTPAKSKAKQKAVGQPVRKTKIDWEAAKRWYLDDARRSYNDVAKEFGVAKSTVEKHAKKGDDSWARGRQELGENATIEFQTEKQKQLADADDRHLKHAKSIQNAAISSLYRVSERNKAAKDAEPIDSNGVFRSAMAIKTGMDYERIVLGLPILISRAETTVADVTPPSIADAHKALDKLEARRKRLNELRRRKPSNS